jgi:hypothetical protein
MMSTIDPLAIIKLSNQQFETKIQHNLPSNG